MIHVIAARKGICFKPGALAFLRINDEGSYSSARSNWGRQREVMKALFRLLIEEPDIWTEDAVNSAILMLQPSEQKGLLEQLRIRREIFEELSSLCINVIAADRS